MWEAAIVAHNRALEKLGDGHLNGYTKNLTEQVHDLLSSSEALERIHDWFKPVVRSLPTIHEGDAA